jgi:hypothetical protein
MFRFVQLLICIPGLFSNLRNLRNRWISVGGICGRIFDFSTGQSDARLARLLGLLWSEDSVYRLGLPQFLFDGD